MTDFTGKTAIVTGAGKGIGRATAILLAERGADVVAVSRTGSDLETLASEIGCRIIAADIGQKDQAHAAASEAGRADFLVNCAGSNVPESLSNFTDDAYDTVMNINLRAAFVFSHHFAAAAETAGTGGAIVNVTSIAGHRGFPDHLTYAASKAGLEAATRVMARELGALGIRANSVAPTVTNTDLAKNWQDPARRDPMIARHPSGRFAEAEEVARTIVMLLGDDAAMTTGAVIPVDGGFLAV